MKKNFRLPLWAGLILFALCAPAAAQVYKCRGADGKMGFSDRPCPEEQRQETVKAAPPPGSVNLELVCSPALLKGERGYMRQAACSAMRRCETTRKEHDCQLYCDAGNGEFIPEVKFGPASAACIKYTGRARGANLVQVSSRTGDSGSFEFFRAACVDKSGQNVDAARNVICERGTDRCSTEFPRSGRNRQEAGSLPGAAPLDALMTRACGG